LVHILIQKTLSNLENSRMAYYISYIVAHGKHSCIALTKTDDKFQSPPTLLCRVGIGGIGQVFLESSFRNLRHKTYPISKSELTKILLRINRDRANSRYAPEDKRLSEIEKFASGGEYYLIGYFQENKNANKRTKFVGSKGGEGRQYEFIESKPGGPLFNFFNRKGGLNCKGYALSVLAEVLVDESLHNPFVPHPRSSGSLHPLPLQFGRTSKKVEWAPSSLPMIIQARTNYNSFEPDELAALNKAREAGKIIVVASPSQTKRRVGTIAGAVFTTGILCIFISTMPFGIFLLAAIATGLIGAKIGHWAASKNRVLNTPHNIFQSRQPVLLDPRQEEVKITHETPRLQLTTSS